MERCLVLWFPDWPITALLRSRELSGTGRAIAADRPIAILAGNAVVACDAAARREGSDSIFFAIDDTDVAGTIPYLAKG